MEGKSICILEDMNSINNPNEPSAKVLQISIDSTPTTKIHVRHDTCRGEVAEVTNMVHFHTNFLAA